MKVGAEDSPFDRGKMVQEQAEPAAPDEKEDAGGRQDSPSDRGKMAQKQAEPAALSGSQTASEIRSAVTALVETVDTPAVHYASGSVGPGQPQPCIQGEFNLSTPGMTLNGVRTASTCSPRGDVDCNLCQGEMDDLHFKGRTRSKTDHDPISVTNMFLFLDITGVLLFDVLRLLRTSTRLRAGTSAIFPDRAEQYLDEFGKMMMTEINTFPESFVASKSTFGIGIRDSTTELGTTEFGPHDSATTPDPTDIPEYQEDGTVTTRVRGVSAAHTTAVAYSRVVFASLPELAPHDRTMANFGEMLLDLPEEERIQILQEHLAATRLGYTRNDSQTHSAVPPRGAPVDRYLQERQDGTDDSRDQRRRAIELLAQPSPDQGKGESARRRAHVPVETTPGGAALSAEAPIARRAPLRAKCLRSQCDSDRGHRGSRAAASAASTGERLQKEGGATAEHEPWPSPSGRRCKKKKNKSVAGAKQEQVHEQATGSPGAEDSAGTAIQ